MIDFATRTLDDEFNIKTMPAWMYCECCNEPIRSGERVYLEEIPVVLYAKLLLSERPSIIKNYKIHAITKSDLHFEDENGNRWEPDYVVWMCSKCYDEYFRHMNSTIKFIGCPNGFVEG